MATVLVKSINTTDTVKYMCNGYMNNSTPTSSPPSQSDNSQDKDSKKKTTNIVKSDSSDTLCFIDEKTQSPNKKLNELSVNSLSPTKNTNENLTSRNIKWSVATERGYEKTTENSRKPIHNFMEDFHFPNLDSTNPSSASADKDSAVHKHPISGLPVYIWLLADGHGGHEAPQYFIKEMKKGMETVIDFHDWNWDKKEECQLFEKFIKDKYKEVDRNFCEMKTNQYIEWKKNNCEGPKPLDDGCTFVVNIIYKNMHINCNVGDSRTVLGRRENIKRNIFSHKESVWSQVFGSRDHAPELSDMAYHIVQNGGIFLNQNGTRRNHGTVVPPSKRGTKPYTDLVGTRIYRPVNQRISDIGISNMRTLNMGATMGDLLFKIEPSILSNEPDVTFNKLNTNKDYLLVIASDGVWDYLKYDYSTTQMNNNLLEFIGLSLTAWCQNINKKNGKNSNEKSSNFNTNSISSEILSDIAKVIVQRDYVKEVYCTGLDKFDDCTAFLVFIPAVSNNSKQSSS